MEEGRQMAANCLERGREKVAQELYLGNQQRRKTCGRLSTWEDRFLLKISILSFLITIWRGEDQGEVESLIVLAFFMVENLALAEANLSGSRR